MRGFAYVLYDYVNSQGILFFFCVLAILQTLIYQRLRFEKC